MRASRLLLIVLLIVLLVSPVGTWAQKVDHDRARQLVESGEILPLETVLERGRAIQPGRVLEVELERKNRLWRYELEILDADGKVWELQLDARSGEFLSHEREH